MPLLIASYRKLQALAMLVGEAAAHNTQNKSGRPAVQSVVSTSVTIAGVVLMAVVLLGLSATILPSWKIFIVLGIIIAIITALSWRLFVKIYSKAQVSLRETLDQPAVVTERQHPSLAGLLVSAQLVAVTITPESIANKRLIRELALRSETGASIVGLERAGVTTVNPGPDEELLAGDQVLLLGKAEQLEKARTLLLQPKI
jgi:CPA2 family monovalent cation:H+ antiporter-2